MKTKLNILGRYNEAELTNYGKWTTKIQGKSEHILLYKCLYILGFHSKETKLESTDLEFWVCEKNFHGILIHGPHTHRKPKINRFAYIWSYSEMLNVCMFIISQYNRSFELTNQQEIPLV